MVSRSVLQQLRRIEDARESGDESALRDALRDADPGIIQHTSDPVRDAEIRRQTEIVDQRIREANARARSNRAARESGQEEDQVTASRVVSTDPTSKYYYGGEVVSREQYYQEYQPKRYRATQQILMVGRVPGEIETQVLYPSTRPVEKGNLVQVDVRSGKMTRYVELNGQMVPAEKVEEPLTRREFAEAYVKKIGSIVVSPLKGVAKVFYAPNYVKDSKPVIDLGQHKVLKTEGALYADPDVQAAASVGAFMTLYSVPIVGAVAAEGLALGLSAERGYQFYKTKDPEILAEATVSFIPLLPRGAKILRRAYVKTGSAKVPAEKIFSSDVLSGKQQFPMSASGKESLARFKRARTPEGDLLVIHASEAPPRSRPRQMDVKTLFAETIREELRWTKPVQKQIVVSEGPMAAAGREDPGLFVTPYGEGSPHFLRIPGKGDVEYTLLPSINRPTAVVIEVSGAKRQPASVLKQPGFQATREFLASEVSKGGAVITKRSEAGFMPEIDPTLSRSMRTRELEAVIPKDTELVLLKNQGPKGFKEYTEFKGEVVPIVRYRTIRGSSEPSPSSKASDVIARYSSEDPGVQKVDVVSSLYATTLRKGVSSVMSRSSRPGSALPSADQLTEFSNFGGSPEKVVSRSLPTEKSQVYVPPSEFRKLSPDPGGSSKYPPLESKPSSGGRDPEMPPPPPEFPDLPRDSPRPSQRPPRTPSDPVRSTTPSQRSPVAPDERLLPSFERDPFIKTKKSQDRPVNLFPRKNPVRQPKRSTPTATAAIFEIKGKSSKAGEFTGFGIRPIPKQSKKKQKKSIMGLL